jgi:mycothiol S-conjugate amidase
MTRTLVALHAHPDDESSKGAATVARYADAGVRCVLVCATGGEAGDILNPAMDLPEIQARLAEVRSAELDEAAAIIGYREVVRLGYRDSGMPGTPANEDPAAFVNIPFDDALEAIVRVVRRERPQVVLGYDDHVRYPHPDHLRIHDLSLAAFDAAGDPGRFPDAGPPWRVGKLYAPVFSVRRTRALHRAMLERGLESPLQRWLERAGDLEDDPVRLTRIPVESTIERARDALRAHRTQIDPDGFWFQVPADVVLTSHPYEDFELLASRVEVDPDETDLFAGT